MKLRKNMSRCVYQPTQKETKQILKINKILQSERGKLLSTDRLPNNGEMHKLENIRFLRRMLFAEGPSQFMYYLAGVKLEEKIQESITEILHESVESI
jgi:hypothetical protein